MKRVFKHAAGMLERIFKKTFGRPCIKVVFKHTAAMLERIPFIAGLVAATVVTYRFYQKQKRFKNSSVELRLLLKMAWTVYRNYSEPDYTSPLIIRKAKAFRKILTFMLHEIESSGIDILLGKEIPNWYPRLVPLKEEFLFTEVGNLTPGYHYVLREGLSGIYDKVKKHENSPTKEGFMLTIEAIRECLDSLKFILTSNESVSADGVTAREIAQWINRSPWHPPETFEEALFATWLLNLLCWYDNHHLIGLGRLDLWLYPYLERDLKNGKITKEKAYERIKQFIRWLNNSRFKKSNVLLGDTGQTLIIGGIDASGRDATNLLSLLFIEALEELRLPEPKLVARIHSNSPDEYVHKLSKLIRLNLGYPLICNDEVVIPTLIKAGYSEEDARNYGVAACWEYLIPGRSFDQGNMGRVPFLVAVLRTLSSAKEEDISTFNDFMKIFEDQLRRLIADKVRTANSRKFIPAPLISIMMESCVEKCRDITEGGAKYNNYGLLGSGFADAVDSLVVIKRTVFEEKVFTLRQIHAMLENNYQNKETTRQYFQHRIPKFGNDDDSVDAIAVQIVDLFAKLVSHHRTIYHGNFRPGLGSEAGYIIEAQNIGATPNGRKAGEPYAINFSPALGAPRLGPTAILRSVTKPDLTLLNNCAVVELSMDTSFLRYGPNDHLWIEWLIRGFLELGGAEMQFNLIDARLLRKAQQYPNQYRNLLIRVWGFSAYFVDLPKEFQDHIIARVESVQI